MEPPPEDRERSSTRWASRCQECEALFAYDQRYCVECGARRGPLSPMIAALLGMARPEALRSAAPELAGGAAEDAAEEHAERPWLPGGAVAPAPSVAAVVVIALLAFGVFLGSAVRPGEESGAAAPLLVAVSRPPTGSSAAAGSAATPAPASSSASPPSPVVSAPTPPAETGSVGTPASSTAPTGPSGPTGSSASRLPPVKHVFLIALADNGFDASFGAGSPAPYLATTLRSQGELLANYYAVAHEGLANAIALISGQGPTPQTASNCPTYIDVTPGTVGASGQITGSGCVYPSRTLTLADQLTAKGKSWRAYIEGIGDGGPGQPSTCRHPTLGSADPAQTPHPADPYVTWRNPFMYFHNLTDAAAACTRNDVGLDRLAGDLNHASTAPSFAYIAPDRCRDGSQSPCAPGQPSGLSPTDTFLRTVVPEIERSPAYKNGGLIAITFDQAPSSGPDADSSACCNAPQYPNLPASPAGPGGPSGASGPTGPTSLVTGAQLTGGGGRVGLLLISSFVKPGTTNSTDSYNHFSLLRSIEDLFGLDHLGYAQDPALPAFDAAVYTGYRGGQ